MSYPPLQTLLASLREEPNSPGVMENTLDALIANPQVDDPTREGLRGAKTVLRARPGAAGLAQIQEYLITVLEEMTASRPDFWSQNFDLEGGRRKSQTKRFGSCVKAVRKTVKARKGSSPESAAIAICTTTLLHPRGRTIKRYRKGRLLTQKRR
jgi:hypothetical protein